MVPKQTGSRTENYSEWNGDWPKGKRSVALAPYHGDPMTLVADCMAGRKLAFRLVVERHEVAMFIEHMHELNVSVLLLNGPGSIPAPAFS